MRHNFAAVMFYDRADGRHSVALGYADRRKIVRADYGVNLAYVKRKSQQFARFCGFRGEAVMPELLCKAVAYLPYGIFTADGHFRRTAANISAGCHARNILQGYSAPADNLPRGAQSYGKQSFLPLRVAGVLPVKPFAAVGGGKAVLPCVHDFGIGEYGGKRPFVLLIYARQIEARG